MTRTATHAKRLHARAVQIGGPLVHELAPPLKQVRAGVGRFDLVPDHVRQGCLGDLARVPFNSLSTRFPIEVSGVEAPQQCEDFVKSMKAGGLGGNGGSPCSTIR